MTKLLMWVSALVIVAAAGAFVNLASPLTLAWGASLVALTFVATLGWVGYTLPKSPDKVAVFIAKYVPSEIGAGIFAEGSAWFDNLRARLKYELDRLGKL